MMKTNIKNYLIANYVKEYKKSPSENEIKLIYEDFIKKNKEVETLGLLVGEKDKLQQAGEESSSKSHEKIKSKLIKDLDFLIKENLKKENELKSFFKEQSSNLNKTISKLENLERNVNKNLLLYSRDDPFSYGIIEDFSDYNKIDQEKSNIYLLNGRATLGFDFVTGESFEQKNISYDLVYRNKGKIESIEYNNFYNALKKDGRFFKVVAVSKYKDETIDFIINIDFDKERYIDTISYTTQSIETNSKLQQNCYWSSDGVNFERVFESGIRVQNNDNFIEVKKERVKSIKIILSKSSSDTKYQNGWGYIFGLDFIGYMSAEYKINEESTLYLGPYEVIDEESNPVNFTMATAKGGTCCIIPDKSSIDLYLSKDNETWIKSDFIKEGKSIVQFEESEGKASDGNVFEILDVNSQSNFISEQIPEGLSLRSSERILNYYIPEANRNKLFLNSINIKRNILKNNKQEIYNASSGWELDSGYYKTNIEVLKMEGIYLDFGESSCFLNDRKVSGNVFLPYGKHTFKTSSENWKIIEEEESINSLRELKQKDPLYPYNHKYIVEGFNYERNFRGTKKYRGVDKIYSFKMKLSSEGSFESSKRLDEYTIKEINNNIYFVIKCNENTGDEKIEDYEISFRKTSISTSNLLYIKAILKSSDTKVTPKIDQIQVRVI